MGSFVLFIQQCHWALNIFLGVNHLCDCEEAVYLKAIDDDEENQASAVVSSSGRAGNHHVVPTNQIDHLPPPQQMIMTMMIMMGHCSLSQTKVQYTSTYRHKSTEGNATALQCDFIELHKFAAHSVIANMQFFGFHAVATGVMVRIIFERSVAK